MFHRSPIYCVFVKAELQFVTVSDFYCFDQSIMKITMTFFFSGYSLLSQNFKVSGDLG